MIDLQSSHAKICWTTVAILVQDDKVLLVKHKKLGIWLNPGGHVEPGELPHKGAEREFWEETGITVKATQPGAVPDSRDSEYLPNPILSNLHWISEANYQARSAGELDKVSGKGCEQHMSLIYLVQPVGSVEFTQNVEETDDIRWFTREEVAELVSKKETKENIQFEIETAFKLL